ncbi:restriction endonuclease subunit S [Microbacterium azadirachtae]|uniref:EcoKI restriction-modification system protein HsdS n=1 Tax=Microbacterium azadirachtae TaxID=582680 RepID=A0A0F0LIZ2_9MICO|nr:restriction endonuclease subunit S [Microbacterium azadirachtae]KJL32255.1 EcoKI restriction-modification system protein HsdS [Microbacterium azadirachtae]
MTPAVESVKLVELLQRPATYGIVKAGEFQTTGIQMLRGGDIKDGKIGYGLPYVTKQKSSEFSRTVLQTGDVVIALVGYPGDSAVIPDRLVGANISRAVGLLRPGRRLLPEYLAQYLNSPVGRAEFLKPSAGSAQIVVNLADLNKLQVPLPGLHEQRQIAETLGDVDGLISSLEKQVAKKRDIKQGMMQELLTGRTRLPGFSGDWRSMKFAEMLSYQQPGRFLVSSTDYVSAGTPVLTAGKTFVLGYTTETTGIYDSPPVIIFDDFTTATKYVDFPFKAKSSAMKILRAKPGADLRFVFERMQLVDFVIVDHKRRWIGEYSKVEVDIPSTDEQRAIARVAEDADAEIAALERRLESAHAIKHGVMQKLLTRRTRLLAKEQIA